jgi:hypothetical protein
MTFSLDFYQASLVMIAHSCLFSISMLASVRAENAVHHPLNGYTDHVHIAAWEQPRTLTYAYLGGVAF